jgi:hypothetical protein
VTAGQELCDELKVTEKTKKETENQVVLGRMILKTYAILLMFTRKDQALLIGRDAFLLEDLRSDICDSVHQLNFRCEDVSYEMFSDYGGGKNRRRRKNVPMDRSCQLVIEIALQSAITDQQPSDNSLVHDLDPVWYDTEAQKGEPSGSSACVRPTRLPGDFGGPERANPLIHRPQYRAEFVMPSVCPRRSKASAPATYQESRSHAADEFDPSVAIFEGVDVAGLNIDEMEDDEGSDETNQKVFTQSQPLFHQLNMISV